MTTSVYVTQKRFPFRIVLFACLTHSLAWLGIYLKQVHEVEGADLIFICPPFVLAFLFSWRDPSINLAQSLRTFKVRQVWRWFLFALLVYPLISLFLTLIGDVTGLVTTSHWQSYPRLVLGALPSVMLFAFLEEFAWRGYLEPFLLARGFAPTVSSLIVGIIWVTWHIPLFVYSYSYNEMYSAAPWLFFALFTITLLITAQVYGVMRRRSQVVWTAVLMHGVGNAFVLPLLTGKQAVWTDYRLDWLILPTPASVLSALIWLGVLSCIILLAKVRP